MNVSSATDPHAEREQPLPGCTNQLTERLLIFTESGSLACAAVTTPARIPAHGGCLLLGTSSHCHAGIASGTAGGSTPEALRRLGQPRRAAAAGVRTSASPARRDGDARILGRANFLLRRSFRRRVCLCAEAAGQSGRNLAKDGHRASARSRLKATTSAGDRRLHAPRGPCMRRVIAPLASRTVSGSAGGCASSRIPPRLRNEWRRGSSLDLPLETPPARDAVCAGARSKRCAPRSARQCSSA